MARKKSRNKLNIVPAKMEITQEETPSKHMVEFVDKMMMDDVPRETKVNTGYKDRNNVDICIGDTLRSISKADIDRYKVCKDETSGDLMVISSLSGRMVASLRFFLLVGTEHASKKAKAEIVK